MKAKNSVYISYFNESSLIIANNIYEYLEPRMSSQSIVFYLNVTIVITINAHPLYHQNCFT